LLSSADPAWIDRDATPPAELPARIIAEVHAERGRRRRQRVTRVVGIAASALLVAMVAVVLVLARDSSEGLTQFAVTAPGVEGKYSVAANDQGTEVHLKYRGLDSDDTYWLWLTDASGKRVSAGTFRGGGEHTITMQSALPTENATRIWVTDAHDAVLLDSQLER
jgi:hypothetical protein